MNNTTQPAEAKAMGQVPHTAGPWNVPDEPSSQAMSAAEDVRCRINMDASQQLGYDGLLGSDQDEFIAKLIDRRFPGYADLLAALPTVPHPGGRLVKVVAHYESGATQTIDGEVILAAIAKARGGVA